MRNYYARWRPTMTKKDSVHISEDKSFTVTVNQIMTGNPDGMGFNLKPDGKCCYLFGSLETKEIGGATGIFFEVPMILGEYPPNAWLGKKVRISITQLDEEDTNDNAN